jgi:cation diffusion facilitator family transporter
MSAEPRDGLLRRAFRLEALTVGWNVVEGVVAVAAGAAAASVALVAFGIDSFIETASAVVVGWRFLDELRHRSPERAERAERIAGLIAGSLLLLLALYISIDALRRLLGQGARSEESLVGIALTAVSLVVMPVLGWAKLRTARALRSGALRADAYETIACAWLSLTTLVGLALNALLGWWWADPAAALVLVPLIVREGLEGLRGEDEDDEDDENE